MRHKKRIWKFFGGGLLATFLVVGIIIAAVFSAISQGGNDLLNGGDSGAEYGDVSNIGLSKEVLAYKDLVEKECREQGVPELVPYVLAIIMNETRGIGNDVMQSSESLKLAAGTLSPA
ncbi:hypothetical protein EQ500_07830, partial [Lactobacillus sp. XV13L]|nr:hypothetical protein [Lactobacillus sp. XV13L]